MAAGSLFGGPPQAVAVCYLYNAGSTPVTISSFRITNRFDLAFALTVNECGHFPVTLAAGKSCGVAVNVNNGAINCRAVVGPDKSDLRGNFDIRDANGLVLQNMPMR